MKRYTGVGMLGACVAAMLLAGARAEDKPASDAAAEKLGWRLAFQCYTFRALTFFETVDIAQKMGIKYLEMYGGQKLKPGSSLGTGPGMTPEAIDEVKKKLQDAGIKLVNIGVGGSAKGDFEFAKKMGIETLVTESTEAQLPGIDKLCAEYSINISLHNHPKPSHYWNADTILAACKDLNLSKRIGSCADTGHWMRSGLNPIECLKKLEGRIVSLHFKDLDKMGGGHDVPWGTGAGDAKGMLAELKRQGFKGVFSIEYETGSGQQLIDNVAKCKEFFDKTAQELLDGK